MSGDIRLSDGLWYSRKELLQIAAEKQRLREKAPAVVAQTEEVGIYLSSVGALELELEK